MSLPDARSSNWRFVVPSDDLDPLLLDEPAVLRGATLTGQSSPAVVVPDVGAWADTARPSGVVDLAAAAVADGGWLCVGFGNRLFPGGRRGAMTLRTARRRLHRAGLVTERVYLPLPDHRHPALLVDAAGRAQLDHVFRTLFLTYLPGSSTRVSMARRLLSAARGAAVLTPHRLRVALAPGYLVLARRPGGPL